MWCLVKEVRMKNGASVIQTRDHRQSRAGYLHYNTHELNLKRVLESEINILSMKSLIKDKAQKIPVSYCGFLGVSACRSVCVLVCKCVCICVSEISLISPHYCRGFHNIIPVPSSHRRQP